MEENIKLLELLIEEHKKMIGKSDEVRISEVLFEKIIQSIENLIRDYKYIKEDNKKTYAKYINAITCIDKLNRLLQEKDDKRD